MAVFHVVLDQYSAKTVFYRWLKCRHHRASGKYSSKPGYLDMWMSCWKQSEISPKRVWGQSNARGRVGGGQGNFVIVNLKANSCYYWPVLFFVCEGGSCPFELFRRCDNGSMLRTYVERPLWLMEEKLHAGPSVWENTRLSPFTPQLMNAWMVECCYRPFRGQSPQEFTLAQTHPAMANTFA